MRKAIAAVTAGLLLIAGQAVASNNGADARVDDRVGARAGASSQFVIDYAAKAAWFAALAAAVYSVKEPPRKAIPRRAAVRTDGPQVPAAEQLA